MNALSTQPRCKSKMSAKNSTTSRRPAQNKPAVLCSGMQASDPMLAQYATRGGAYRLTTGDIVFLQELEA
jgi:hypothetical protein